MKYPVVIERIGTGHSANVPDLPGCVAASRTAMGVRRLMREAVELHLEGMRDDGLCSPETQRHDHVYRPPAAHPRE